jgi:hypothetical protein
MKNGSFQILLFEDNAADAFLVRMALDEVGLPFQLEVCSDGAGPEPLFCTEMATPSFEGTANCSGVIAWSSIQSEPREALRHGANTGRLVRWYLPGTSVCHRKGSARVIVPALS